MQSQTVSHDEVAVFKEDSAAGKEPVRKYGDGKGEAPLKDF